MDRGLHRFVGLLRVHGVRVSVTETLDAMRAAALRSLADRETLRVALVKDRREEQLFDWLDDPDADVSVEALAALAAGSGGAIVNLADLLKRHPEALAARERAFELPARRAARAAGIGEAERRRLEETLRRLARTMPGALTHRRAVAGRGRVDPARTMRANMRFDGIPSGP